MRKKRLKKGIGRRPSTDRNARPICIKHPVRERRAGGVIWGTFSLGVEEPGKRAPNLRCRGRRSARTARLGAGQRAGTLGSAGRSRRGPARSACAAPFNSCAFQRGPAHSARPATSQRRPAILSPSGNLSTQARETQPVRRLRTRPLQGRCGGLGAQPPEGAPTTASAQLHPPQPTHSRSSPGPPASPPRSPLRAPASAEPPAPSN